MKILKKMMSVIAVLAIVLTLSVVFLENRMIERDTTGHESFGQVFLSIATKTETFLRANAEINVGVEWKQYEDANKATCKERLKTFMNNRIPSPTGYNYSVSQLVIPECHKLCDNLRAGGNDRRRHCTLALVQQADDDTANLYGPYISGQRDKDPVSGNRVDSRYLTDSGLYALQAKTLEGNQANINNAKHDVLKELFKDFNGYNTSLDGWLGMS